MTPTGPIIITIVVIIANYSSNDDNIIIIGPVGVIVIRGRGTPLLLTLHLPPSLALALRVTRSPALALLTRSLRLAPRLPRSLTVKLCLTVGTPHKNIGGRARVPSMFLLLLNLQLLPPILALFRLGLGVF